MVISTIPTISWRSVLQGCFDFIAECFFDRLQNKLYLFIIWDQSWACEPSFNKSVFFSSGSCNFSLFLFFYFHKPWHCSLHFLYVLRLLLNQRFLFSNFIFESIFIGKQLIKLATQNLIIPLNDLSKTLSSSLEIFSSIHETLILFLLVTLIDSDFRFKLGNLLLKGSNVSLVIDRVRANESKLLLDICQSSGVHRLLRLSSDVVVHRLLWELILVKDVRRVLWQATLDRSKL